MIEKILNTKEKKILIIFCSLVIVYSVFFVLSFLKSQLIYKKVSESFKPNLASEKARYYDRNIPLISKAISMRGDNSQYYSKKADYFSEKISDGLVKDLKSYNREIKDLYLKAIQLNPTNFEYHLKLGWFYADKDDKEAEKEFKKSTQLYPSNYEIYLYLWKHYSKGEKSVKAFNNLISFFLPHIL